MDVDDTRILHTTEALLSGTALGALPQDQRQVLATCLLLYAGAASEGQQEAFVAHLQGWADTRLAARTRPQNPPPLPVPSL